MQTPLWVPIVVVAIGVLGTLAGGIAGVLITQRRSDRRDDKTWKRERQRERERWDREDNARTFDHRRAAYIDFYEALQATSRAIHDQEAESREQPPRHLIDDMLHKYNQIVIYATPVITQISATALGLIWGIAYGVSLRKDDRHRYNEAVHDLLQQIRKELRVPGAVPDAINPLDAMGPGSGVGD